MRERLARVAGKITRSAALREKELAAEPRELLMSVVSALGADYADCPTFTGDADDPDAFDRLVGLVDVFGLSELETSLLEVALAPELDANIGVAYDLLSGRPPSGRTTVALALELCAAPTSQPMGFEALHPLSALRRNRLLDVAGDGAWLRRTLVIPDRVAAHLAGADTPPASVLSMIADAVAFPCPAADLITRAVEAGAELVWVRSLLGTAGASVAVAGFAAAGLASVVVDARRVPGGVALVDAVAECAREAAFLARALVVTGADALAEPDAVGALELLRTAAVPVVAVGTRPWNPLWLREVPLSVDAPILAADDRASIWQLALQGGDAQSLTTLRLTPEDILATARYAQVLAAARGESPSTTQLRDAARVLGAGAGSGRVAARALGAPATFADLILPGRVREELERLVRWAAHRDDVLARGPVHGKGGKGTGITALFTGSPGTGKTLAAHVIADELESRTVPGRPVRRSSTSTSARPRRTWSGSSTRPRAGNVVLFFDEADALFGSRSEVKDARDRYANQEVSYLLQRMEHFDGITVLATNLRGNLDQAFSRRMQFIVHFPDPDAPTRGRLWHAAPVPRRGARSGRSRRRRVPGRDRRTGRRRHPQHRPRPRPTTPPRRGQALGMRHVRAATSREYQKLGRRLPGAVETT